MSQMQLQTSAGQILNHFLDNENIPPLLIDRKIVFNSQEKANLFNNLFASIFTLINQTSTFPSF